MKKGRRAFGAILGLGIIVGVLVGCAVVYYWLLHAMVFGANR